MFILTLVITSCGKVISSREFSSVITNTIGWKNVLAVNSGNMISYPLTGTCTPDAGDIVVEIGTPLITGATFACVKGEFGGTIDLSTVGLPEGDIVMMATQSAITATATTTLVVDTVPPGAPVITSPTTGTTVNGRTQTVTGTCEDGATIIFAGDISNSSPTVCTGGNFSGSVNLTIGDGSKTITASQRDVAGNVSPTDSVTITLDASFGLPLAPTIDTPVNGSLTNQLAQTVTGLCEDGATVFILGNINGAPVSTPCTAGAYSQVVNLTAANGAKTISARQTNAVGSSPTVSISITLDNINPLAPVVTAPTNGSSTSQTAVTVTGTCENGSTVNVNGDVVGAPLTTACVGGNFSVPATYSPGEGTKTIAVTQTDPAGNTSPATNVSVTLDQTAPNPPVITAPADSSLTNQVNQTVVGTCEAGATVSIGGNINGAPVTAFCLGGNFTTNVTLTAGDGTKTISAIQTDSVGNVSTADSISLTLDTTPPIAPTITAPTHGSYTNTTTETVTGACETGATVNITGNINGSPITVTCTASTYSSSVTYTSGDGAKTITASQTDPANNPSPSTSVTVNVITSGPSAPTITAPVNNSYTNSLAHTVTGTCQTNATVNITGSFTTSPASVLCSSGSYSQSITLTSGDGAKTVSATQTDLASNTSPATTITVNLDQTTPAAVTITAPANGAYLNSTSQTVTGSCETDATVNLSGDLIGAPVSFVCSSGAYSQAVTLVSGDGTKTMSATQTDRASNTSSATSITVNLMTGLPAAPTITAPADGLLTNLTAHTVTGTCLVDATVNLTGGIVGSPVSLPCTAGGTYSQNITLTSGDGAKTISATQTDLASNTSPATTITVNLDQTAPSAPMITSPTDGSLTNTTSQTVIGTCENNATVTLTGNLVGAPITASCLAGNFTSSVTLTSGDGTKTITAAQTDQAGNTSGSTTITVELDATVPAAPVITAPANGAIVNTLAQTVTGTCETDSTVNLSGAFTGSPLTATCVASAFSQSITLTTGDGSKTIAATQTDQASNTSTSTSISITLDQTAPSVVVSTLASNPTSVSPIPVTITFSEAVTGFLVGEITVTNGTLSGFAGTGTTYTVNVTPTAPGAVTVSVAAGVANDVASNPNTVSNTLSLDYELPMNMMITRWQLTNPNLTVTLPLQTGFNYNFTVNWGDGTPVQTVTAWNHTNRVHTYAAQGTYDITIEGTVEAWGANPYLTSGCRITEVLRLGQMGWRSFANGFNGCANLTTFNSSGTTFTTVTNMSGMFRGASLVNPSVGSWDVSNVTDMSFMFANTNAANPNTTNWDVGNVTNMASMFSNTVLANPDTSTWDVSNVTNMSLMFNVAAVASPSTGSWNTGSVTDLSYMFQMAPNANPNVTGWNTANVTNMQGLFSSAVSAVPNVTGWDTSNVTTMQGMFREADSANPNVASWNTSNVTNMVEMFYGADIANPNVASWDVSNVTTMAHMFQNAVNANPDASGWSVANVISMQDMFTNSGLTTRRYTEFLIMANATTTRLGVNLHSRLNYYWLQADADRTNLINNRFWTIYDLGMETVPAPTITSPANGSSTNQFAQTVTGACESGATVRLTGDINSAPVTSLCSANAYSIAVTVSSGDGSKTITAMQERPDGATSATVSSTFTLTTGLPAAPTITAPTNGSRTNLVNHTVTGTCLNAHTVNISGDILGSPVSLACSSGSYSQNVTLTSGDGAKTISATQTDVASNTSPATSITVTLDQTAPLAPTITSPVDEALTSTTAQTVIGACETGATVSLTGNIVGAPVTASCLAGNYTSSVTLTSGDGVKTITAGQTDVAGNVSPTTSISVTLDATAPAAPVITAPTNGSYTNLVTQTVTGTCETDATVNLSGAFTGSPLTATCAAGNFSRIITLTTSDGAKIISATQTDQAGNTSVATSVTVNLDRTAPTVNLTYDAGLPNTTTPTPLTITFSEAVTGFVMSDILTTNATLANFAGGPTVYTVDVIPTSPGLYYARVPVDVAADAAANLNTASNVMTRTYSYAPNMMITRWQLTNPNLTVTLPLQSGYNYNFTVNWGDGTPVQTVTAWNHANRVHTYAAQGTYNISITGSAQAWGGDPYLTGGCRITDVLQLGEMGWTSFRYGFKNCRNLTTFNSVGTTFTPVDNLHEMFYDARMVNPDVSTWDVSNVTSVAGMFGQAFMANPDVSAWDVRNVRVAYNMFTGATSADPDVSAWQTDSLENIVNMFRGATMANPDVSNWNTSRLTNIDHAFRGAIVANPDVSGWDVSRVRYMAGVFANAAVANPDVSAWDTSLVENMQELFMNTPLANPDVSSWNVSNVQNMAEMFRNAPNANPNMNSWIMTNVTNMTNMFTNSGLSTQNYTNFLIRANATTTQDNVTLHSRLNYYWLPAVADRDNLINVRGWTIYDLGLEAPAAPTITSPAANSYVNIASQTVTGACETGATVTISGDVAANGTGLCSSGTYSIGVNLQSPDGVKTITASQVGAGGAPSLPTSINVTLDTTIPVAPTIVTPADGLLTNISTHTATGACENGATVTLFGNITGSPVTVLCSSNAYSQNITLTSGDGGKTISATQTDLANNISPATTITVTLDTSPPVAPTITSPTNGSHTNLTAQTVTGACETNANVSISGNIVGGPVVVVCTASAYSTPVTLTSGDGLKTITAAQTDLAGNLSPSTSISVSLDQTVPAAPMITAPANNSYTNTFAQTVTGTCEANINVELTGSFTPSPVTVVCSVGGTFSRAITLTAGDGAKTISAIQTDLAGNVSPAATITVNLDQTAPSVVVSTLASDPTTVSPIPVTFTFNEAVTGFALSDIIVTNGAPSALAGGPAVYTANITPTVDGEVTIRVPASAVIDGASNPNTASNTLSIEYVEPTNIMITRWQLVNPNRTVTLPLQSGYNYSFVVDWGDGTSPQTVTSWNHANSVHTYSAPGTYDITIRGLAEAWGAATYATGGCRITQVIQLGDMGWRSFENGFRGCGNLGTVFNTTPSNFATVTNMSNMFRNAANANPDVSTWDVSQVTDMSGMFYNAVAATPNVTTWDVSNVTTTANMFRNASSANPDVATWAVLNVTNMSGMFYDALSAQPTVDEWNVGQVTNMSNLFRNAYSAMPNVGSWDVSNATNMSFMFAGTQASNPDVAVWDVSNVTTMAGMFMGALAADPAVGTWVVGGVTDMSQMFMSTSIANPDIDNWNVSSVTNMASMFESATATNPDIRTWNVSAATNMSRMFYDAVQFNRSMSSWNVVNVIEMTDMFTSSALSTANYTSFLEMANATTAQNNVTLHSALNYYWFQAEDDRDNLINVRGWTIYDYGLSSIALPTIASPANNSYRNTTALTVTGSCLNGATVRLFFENDRDPTPAAGTAVCAGSAYSISATLGAGDGPKIISVNQINAAGAHSAYVTRTINLDQSTPAAPTIATPADGSLTNVTGHTVTGSCETSSTVTLSGSITGSPVTTTCTGGGTYSRAVVLTSGDGTKTISATQTDLASNVSAATTIIVTLDQTPPAAPTITSPTDSSLTNTFSQTVIGACETNATVSITGNVVGAPVTATCLAGNYSTSVTLTAGDGSKTITAGQTDLAGNASSTTSITLTVDATAPAAPVITAPINNSYTNTLAQTVSGTCEANSNITLTGSFSSSPASIACTGGGTFSQGVTLTSGEGAKTFSATQTDEAGNTSLASVTTTITLDQTAPTVNLTTAAGLPNSTTPVPMTITFSEAVTGFVVSDITTSGAMLSNFTGGPTVYTVDVIPTVMGPYSVSVAAGVAVDVATNLNTASNTINRTYEYASNMMVTRWQLTNPNLTVTLPLQSGYNYNFTVNWGDGTPEQTITAWNHANRVHTYSAQGTYDITITGTAEAWGANPYATGGCRITDVVQLGEMGWRSFSNGFRSCLALTNFNSTGSNFSNVTNMSSMFNNARLVTPDTSDWDVSAVTSMASMFEEAKVAAPNTSAWDVSNVTNMSGLFAGASNANPDTSSWDVGNVTNMSFMFYETPLADPETSGWDVSSVVNMRFLFYRAPLANPNVGSWNTSSATDTSYMFFEATSATPNVTSWNVGNVTNMTSMFEGAASADPNVSNWNVSNVTLTQAMFRNATSANPNFSNWNMRVISNMANMFTNSGLSAQNYTNFLIRANATTTRNNVTLHSRLNYYWLPAVADRDNLINVRGWAIYDLGLQSTAAPSITAPADSSYTNNLSQTVTGACQTGATVTISGSISPTNVTGTCTASAYSIPVTLTTGDGTKTINASQVGSSGPSATTSISITLDQTVPGAPTITSPTNVIYTNNTSQTITGACETNAMVNISGNITGSPVTVLCTASSYTRSVTLTSGDGAKTISATQTDIANNTSTATSIVINLDQTPPARPTINPPSNYYFNSRSYTMTGGCIDGSTVNITGDIDVNPAPFICSGSAYSVPLMIEAIDGNKTISITQTDPAGNTSLPRDLTITLDETVPLAPTITSPTNGSSTTSVTQTVTGGCEHNGVTVFITGNIVGGPVSVLCSGTSYSQSVTLAAGLGSKTITAYQRDLAHNISPTRSVTITLTAAATLAFTSPTAGTALAPNTAFTITGTCDAGGGVVNLSGTSLQAPVNGACSGGGTFSINGTSVASGQLLTVLASQVDSGSVTQNASVNQIMIHCAGVAMRTCAASGSGNPVDPYEIGDNISCLQEMRTGLTCAYALVDDVDATATSTWNIRGSEYLGWIPVPDTTDENIRFTGTLDGRGHTITNLYIKAQRENGSGLFSRLSDEGNTTRDIQVSDITFVNPQLSIHSAENYLVQASLAVLAGRAYTTTIDNVTVVNALSDIDVLETHRESFGFIVGEGTDITLSNSNATGTFVFNGQDNLNSSRFGHVGALAGLVRDSSITNNYANVSITSDINNRMSFLNVGGAIGLSYSSEVSQLNVTVNMALNHRGNATNESYGAIGGAIGSTVGASLVSDICVNEDITLYSDAGRPVGAVGGFIGNMGFDSTGSVLERVEVAGQLSLDVNSQILASAFIRILLFGVTVNDALVDLDVTISSNATSGEYAGVYAFPSNQMTFNNVIALSDNSAVTNNVLKGGFFGLSDGVNYSNLFYANDPSLGGLSPDQYGPPISIYSDSLVNLGGLSNATYGFGTFGTVWDRSPAVRGSIPHIKYCHP